MSEAHKILVVDDEQVVCLSCQAIFSQLGFEIETTNSPVEGLRLAQEHRCDVILLDIIMPEMTGLEFLERLRRFDATVPVVIITGYASVTSAAEAMRLHASDYVPKPFTPEEIIAAVHRVLSLEPSKAPSPAETKLQPWVPTGRCLFLDQAWVRQGTDGTARAGAFIPSGEGRTVEAIDIPAVGTRVQEGLPLAELIPSGGRRRIIPSPVTGDIIEVNRALLDAPARGWDDPCSEGWLVRVEPDETEPPSLAFPRRVMVVSRDSHALASHRKRLERFGCLAETLPTPIGVREALRQSQCEVLLIDGGALDADVPHLVADVRQAIPGLRVVVVAPAGWAYQGACRELAVFRYLEDPIDSEALIDVLDAAFQAPPPVLAPAVVRGALPDAIRVLRMTNRHGALVSLLAPDGVLLESRGVGQVILQGVRELALPVRLTLGQERLGSADIWSIADQCDRGYLLVPQEAGRIPGSLVRESTTSPWTPAGVAEDRITTLVIQAAPTGSTLDFDFRTNETLGRLILSRLTAARKSPGR
jgi:CheY-like chemotaxis protein/glycine cleavage system H lipoate-binding protein